MNKTIYKDSQPKKRKKITNVIQYNKKYRKYKCNKVKKIKGYRIKCDSIIWFYSCKWVISYKLKWKKMNIRVRNEK